MPSSASLLQRKLHVYSLTHNSFQLMHDDVIKWKHFPRHWPFARGIRRWQFPAQRPVTRSFDVFFDLRLNKRLSKQPWGWWFETPSHPWWRHCNVICCLSFKLCCYHCCVPFKLIFYQINIGIYKQNTSAHHDSVIDLSVYFADISLIISPQVVKTRYCHKATCSPNFLWGQTFVTYYINPCSIISKTKYFGPEVFLLTGIS